jgi:hypothetical protein
VVHRGARDHGSPAGPDPDSGDQRGVADRAADLPVRGPDEAGAASVPDQVQAPVGQQAHSPHSPGPAGSALPGADRRRATTGAARCSRLAETAGAAPCRIAIGWCGTAMCPVSAWRGTRDVAGLCKTSPVGQAQAGGYGSGWTGPRSRSGRIADHDGGGVLAPAEYVDSGHPLVAARAGELCGTAWARRDAARAVFYFVRDLRYEGGDFEDLEIYQASRERRLRKSGHR